MNEQDAHWFVRTVCAILLLTVGAMIFQAVMGHGVNEGVAERVWRLLDVIIGAILGRASVQRGVDL